jgi:hypothetical protein
MSNSLSMYSINENIYCSQLSSVAVLLQPEPNCFTSYNTRKGLCSLSLLSSCGLRLPLTCLVLTVKEARSYFASTIGIVPGGIFPAVVSCSQCCENSFRSIPKCSYFPHQNLQGVCKRKLLKIGKFISGNLELLNINLMIVTRLSLYIL